jgi:hypothetical protein
MFNRRRTIERCLVFLTLLPLGGAEALCDQTVSFVFGEGEIIRAEEINQNNQQLLDRIIALEEELAKHSQDEGIAGSYRGIGSGSRFKSYESGASIETVFETTNWSEVTIDNELALFGLRSNSYSILWHESPGVRLESDQDSEGDGGSGLAVNRPLAQLSLVQGTGGVGSLFSGEIYDYQDGQSATGEVLDSMTLLFYRVSEDVLIYQVSYKAENESDLADHGLGYEDGILVRVES